ncbi:hypothetical protein B0H10DRAFT_1628385, partial [Mycena sp. CBHHK59/15]
EELLIDFRELVGEHSGENMAEEVWSCLELYGLDDGRVSINADDDLNDLPNLFEAVRIVFDATAARICCMPHTAHLA